MTSPNTTNNTPEASTTETTAKATSSQSRARRKLLAALIAINLIGTYVHTNRLQYVEFFSKFYEGGGRSFTPLSVNTKYYKFTEEKTNG